MTQRQKKSPSWLATHVFQTSNSIDSFCQNDQERKCECEELRNKATDKEEKDV